MMVRWRFIRRRMKMPCKMDDVSPFVSAYKKSTHKMLCKCLIFFALPQGLEPWTL